MELVIATRNAGKRREFARLAEGLGLHVRSLDEFPEAGEPAETGETFEENALIKARAAAEATGLWALADDSGLCVDALDGAPGVRSARYAEGSDADRWRKLLEVLANVPDSERGAAFVCVLALVSPDGREIVESGRCEGTIAREPKGAGGFGYDPVFQVKGDAAGRTMAELAPEEKGAISHRARAFAALRPHLARVVRAG